MIGKLLRNHPFVLFNESNFIFYMFTSICHLLLCYLSCFIFCSLCNLRFSDLQTIQFSFFPFSSCLEFQHSCCFTRNLKKILATYWHIFLPISKIICNFPFLNYIKRFSILLFTFYLYLSSHPKLMGIIWDISFRMLLVFNFLQSIPI